MIAKPLLREEITEQLRRLAYERRGTRSVRIEPERELAKRFNISRLSLRAAIKSLVDEGLRDDVRARRYPGPEHTVFMKEDELAKFKQLVGKQQRKAG